MRRNIFSGFLTVVGLLLAAAPADLVWAQAVATAQLSGSVTDPSGAPIPNAKVSVTQTATGSVRTAQSGADGSYLLPELAVGPYKLQVEAKGFGAYVQNGINLEV